MSDDVDAAGGPLALLRLGLMHPDNLHPDAQTIVPMEVLCPRCSTYDMDAGRSICENCEDEIAEENPDGQWVFSRDAGCWVYE
jgi:hypothetical protein